MTDTATPDDKIAHDAPITDEERERTQRDVVRFLAAFVVFAIAAAIGFLATHHSAGSADDSGAITADPIDAIGPVAGVELASYTQRRQVALGKVTTSRATAASFSHYMTEADARRVLQGFDVKALLIAAPGGEPEVVRGALDRWAATARQDAADQKKQFQD